VQIDELSTPKREIDGQVAAMVLCDARRAHAEASPACTRSDAWFHGWDYGETKEVQP